MYIVANENISDEYFKELIQKHNEEKTKKILKKKDKKIKVIN